MKCNQYELQRVEDAELADMNLDDLVETLDADLENSLADLEILKEDREKIGNPASLSETVMNVVWEQFLNQVGAVAGEEFIRENRGLTLDLSNDAHIQTADNFKDGKLASHNHYSKEKLEQNYDRFKNKPHSVYRHEYVNPGMDKTLKRAGSLNNEGTEYVKDIYTGRQIPTKTKLEDGSNNPMAAQREHVRASAKLYENPSLQMSYSDQELADIINNPNNLQGYTTAERNNRKSDNTPETMEERDKNKHWEKAHKKADDFITQKEQEGEQRLRDEGRKTQRQEAARMGKHALQGIAMSLLAALVKSIFQKFAVWLKSKQKSLSSFIDKVKEAIKKFVMDLKQHLKIAAHSAISSIASMIFGPIVRTLQKAWTFIKQGYKSLKEAISYIKNPANKKKPFSILMMEVGKIIITGLSAAGAIVLGGAIEGALSTVPFFAFEIPVLGSLASILGLFLGALISGLIGAIALNLIDKWIAKKQKDIKTGEIIQQKNKVLDIQNKLLHVSQVRLDKTKETTATQIVSRHIEAAEIAKAKISEIHANISDICDDSYLNDITPSQSSKELDNLLADLEAI